MRFRAIYVGDYVGERHDVFLACDFQHAAKTAESTRRIDERLLAVEVVAEAAQPMAIIFVPTGGKPREGEWCFTNGDVTTAVQARRDHVGDCCIGYRRVDLDLSPTVSDLADRIVRALGGR